MPRKKTEKKAEPKAHADISPQPEINIGMIGHVDHGKTTLVQALSGKWTDTHSEEIKRGITIRLGYADVKIYKCDECLIPDAYSITEKCEKCGKPARLQRIISLVDAPGHESLMATMLCGANIMDGALLLVAANEEVPQPQTMEHLTALQIIGVEKVIVIQNKIDLVTEEQAQKNYQAIKDFLKGTKFEDAPIVPMAALHKANLDVLIASIQELFQTPKRDTSAKPFMFIARSFDVNKPGTTPEKMIGGILGGTLKQGAFKVGDEIEISPGFEKQKTYHPLKTKIVGILTGGKQVQHAGPGGSIAVLTQLDPSVVKSDQLVGAIAGHPGTLPKIWTALKLETQLLERVVGVKDKLVVEPIKKGEVLMLNVNSAATVGVVQELGKNTFKTPLRKPVCADIGARVTISRMVGQRWRLIGYGTIKE